MSKNTFIQILKNIRVLINYNYYRTDETTTKQYKHKAAVEKMKAPLNATIIAIGGRTVASLLISILIYATIKTMLEIMRKNFFNNYSIFKYLILFTLTFLIIMYCTLKINWIEYNESLKYVDKRKKRKYHR